MYIATTYIGSAFAPGEAIPDDYPADKLEWLIKAGAIRQAAPAPSATAAGEDQTAAPIEELPETDADEIDADEIDTDEEAPEIDVMAGVVKEAEQEQKPAPKPRAANKKAPKGGKTK